MEDDTDIPSAINYAELRSNCQISPNNYSASSYDDCFPRLALPSQVQALNPTWSNCDDSAMQYLLLGNIHDPPRVLVPTNALLALGPSKTLDPPFSAAPASTPLHFLAPVTGARRSASPSPISNKQPAPPNAGRAQSDQNTGPDSTGEPQDLSQADSPSQGDPAPSPLPSESDPWESTQAPNDVDPDSTGEPKHPSQADPQSGGDPPTSTLQTRVIQWGVTNHQMQIFRLKAARSLHPQ